MNLKVNWDWRVKVENAQVLKWALIVPDDSNSSVVQWKGDVCHYKNERSWTGLWSLQMNQKRSFLPQHLADSENHCYRRLYSQRFVCAKKHRKRRRKIFCLLSSRSYFCLRMCPNFRPVEAGEVSWHTCPVLVLYRRHLLLIAVESWMWGRQFRSRAAVLIKYSCSNKIL